MRRILYKKIEEAFVSVFPVTLIVFILNLTPLINLGGDIWIFLVSAIFLILGIGLFNLGADLAMTPMGEHVGSGLTRSKNITLLLSVCFLMGLLITVAEPDLTVLASQVSAIMNGTVLIFAVGAGVGLFLLIVVLKIIFRVNLSSLLMFFYMLLFALTSLVVINGNAGFLPLAFDSGGVTTGPITVPFLMALGVGIAGSIGGKDSSGNSFGLVAMCSVGPILAVMLLGISANGSIDYGQPSYPMDIAPMTILHILAEKIKEVALALGLIVIFFAVLQMIFLKLPKKKLYQIAVGIGYTFTGLVVFLTAVTVGFMPIGYRMGEMLAASPRAVVIGFGFVIGAVVVLAEPAVHVLNKQVEEITDGTVTKRSMLIALSVGVGISIGLSMLRIIFDFSVLYYLIPGYFLSLGLSFFVPRLYTAIAFDSGGVASGPLTSTFILPFAIGVCYSLHGADKIMSDAFGIVAMVAMTPLITIQLLGFRAIMTRKVKESIAMKRILGAEDEQIINFM